jgi:hypothetical protein
MDNELEIKIINNLPPLNVFLRNPHQVLRFCVIHEGNKWFFKWQLTVDRDAFRQEFEFKKVYQMSITVNFKGSEYSAVSIFTDNVSEFDTCLNIKSIFRMIMRCNNMTMSEVLSERSKE